MHILKVFNIFFAIAEKRMSCFFIPSEQAVSNENREFNGYDYL